VLSQPFGIVFFPIKSRICQASRHGSATTFLIAGRITPTVPARAVQIFVIHHMDHLQVPVRQISYPVAIDSLFILLLFLYPVVQKGHLLFVTRFFEFTGLISVLPRTTLPLHTHGRVDLVWCGPFLTWLDGARLINCRTTTAASA